MAAAIITDTGLRRRLGASLVPQLFLRLFRNDIDVFTGSTLDAYETALFPGYADIALTNLWSAPQLDPLGRAYCTAPNLTWTRGAGSPPETEYGWVLYEDPAPDSVLVAGRRFTIPQSMVIPGDTVMVSLIWFLLRG